MMDVSMIISTKILNHNMHTLCYQERPSNPSLDFVVLVSLNVLTMLLLMSILIGL